MLLGNGADIEANDKLESTALQRAANHGKGKVVRVFLKKGAKIMAPDNGHSLTLHLQPLVSMRR